MNARITNNGRRVAIIGKRGRVEQAQFKNPEQLIAEIGSNTGNLAFWYAISRHIGTNADYINWNFDPQHIKSEYDVIVFAAANQLNPNFDLGDLANSLEKCDKPLVVLGLGAQAANFEEKIELKTGTKRLLSVFSERTVRIGMRGAFSAEVALANGAKNVVVIGCPSNFINLVEKNLGGEIEKRMVSMANPYRLVVNLDLVGRLKIVIRKCVTWMEQWRGYLVVQSPLSAIQLSLGRLEKVPKHDLEIFSQLLLDRNYDENARSFLLSQLLSFFDVESWMSFLRGSQFSLGTRIHGNLLALQSGVPSFIIPHDSRTRELATTVGMPIVELETVERTASLPDLIKSITFDGSTYDRLRRKLAGDYVSLLLDSDLTVASEMVQFARSLPCAKPKNPIAQEASVTMSSTFQIQRDNTTKSNRHPEIFAAVTRLCELSKKQNLKVLSFGCSTGEEPLCLAQDYLKKAQIIALDASLDALKIAKAERSLGDRIIYDISNRDTLKKYGPYDVIFAMSVLCRWPVLANEPDATALFPFSRYLEMVKLLDEHLNPTGLLVIYNSNYSFADSALISGYETILLPTIAHNGYVKHFDTHNKEIVEYCGADVLYRKLSRSIPSPPGTKVLRLADESGRSLGAICTTA